MQLGMLMDINGISTIIKIDPNLPSTNLRIVAHKKYNLRLVTSISRNFLKKMEVSIFSFFW